MRYLNFHLHSNIIGAKLEFDKLGKMLILFFNLYGNNLFPRSISKTSSQSAAFVRFLNMDCWTPETKTRGTV